MKGILYGVGTGPGDPELLTLKALKIIKESDIIIIPSENPGNCASYRTVAEIWPRIAEKDLLCLTFPMTRDMEKRLVCCEKNADIIADVLSSGRQAAFLTIGDPSVYSTYGYIYKILRRRGYDARMISGVPSFCAAAAELGEILCEDTQNLEIIPFFAISPGEASGEPEDKFRDSSGSGSGIFSGRGTKVLMKPGKNYPLLKDLLRRSGRKSVMIENCGREGERLYFRPADFPDDIPYFSIIISKPADDPGTDRGRTAASITEKTRNEVNSHE